MNYFRFIVALPSESSLVLLNDTSSNEWIHIVMNYIGPNDGQGFRIYQNSRLVANRTTLQTFSDYISGNRNIVIGKFFNNADFWYSSVQVDELYFFNRVLTEAEIRMLSQNTNWVRAVPQKTRKLQCTMLSLSNICGTCPS